MRNTKRNQAPSLKRSWPGLPGDERGSVVLIVVVFLAVIFGLAALVIDLGHLFVVHSNLQNTADSASLAAAASLSYGPDEARNQAQLLAHKHGIDGTLVTLALADIELGTWDKETKTFTVLEAALEQNADSVRVTAQRTQTRDNPVPLFLMPIFGRETSDVGAISVATRAGDCMGGIIGETRITLNSSATTDSYDSSSGPYSPATPGQNGDVCSCGDIELNSSAVVNGDAHPGPDHSVTINSSAYVTGSTSSSGSCPVLPDVELGDIATINDNGNIGLTDDGNSPFPNGPYALELSSSDGLPLPGGEYYFTSVALNSGATLRVEGPTVMYVTGSFAVSSSGIMNTGQNPQDLVVMISSTGDVQLNSSVDFYGVIYAPNAHVVNNSDVEFYGSIMADEVSLNSSVQVHYDEALSDLSFLDGMEIAFDGTVSSTLVR